MKQSIACVVIAENSLDNVRNPGHCIDRGVVIYISSGKCLTEWFRFELIWNGIERLMILNKE